MRTRSLCLVVLSLVILVASSTTAHGQTLRAQAVVTSGLASPLYLAAPPGDNNRLFIVEKGTGDASSNGLGAIRVFDLTVNALLPTPYLTIPVSTNSERGLLGLAFDPNFATNGWFYTFHTKPGASTVTATSASAGTATPTTPAGSGRRTAS